MICKKCGTENKEENFFCKECGAPLQADEEAEDTKDIKGHKIVSVWTYLSYQILFLIPVVGLVTLLFLALGGTDNRNIRNFAIAYLCKILILVVIVVALFLTGVVSVTDLLYL